MTGHYERCCCGGHSIRTYTATTLYRDGVTRAPAIVLTLPDGRGMYRFNPKEDITPLELAAASAYFAAAAVPGTFTDALWEAMNPAFRRHWERMDD